MQDDEGEGAEGEGRKKKRKKRRRDRSLELDEEDFDLLEEQGVKVHSSRPDPHVKVSQNMTVWFPSGSLQIVSTSLGELFL